MKLLFINKPFVIEPLGIMYLASSIKEKGHEVDLALTSEDLEKKLKEYQPDIVAYSIMTGDQEFYNSINKRLKEERDFFSIAGGPHPTFFPEMLEQTSFDAICRGEGEIAIQQLLENPKSLEIPNFHFKAYQKIIKNPVQPLISNLDKIAFPERKIVLKYDKIKQDPIKHFIASRGCPYNCSYCFNESYSELYSGKGKRVRFRSVYNLLKEIKSTLNDSTTRFIYFQDDTFILKSEWLREFSEKYNKEINLPFHCHTRANLVTKDIVKNLKQAGCYSVHIAAESGNDEIRKDVLNRQMSNEQIIYAVNLLKKEGIRVMLQNILGLPFSTLENDFETLELNIKCQPDYAWASIFQPYPKTTLGQRCLDSGFYTGDFSDLNSSFFDSSVLNIQNKNEIANLQKLFAIAVKNPELYSSGRLRELIKIPHESIKEKLSKIYQSFRKKADKELFGFDL